MYLASVSVLRSGNRAVVMVHGIAPMGNVLKAIPFSRVKSVSHLELARRACRIVGGTPLQRQVDRSKVKGVWFDPDKFSPVMDTGADATREDETHGRNEE